VDIASLTASLTITRTADCLSNAIPRESVDAD